MANFSDDGSLGSLLPTGATMIMSGELYRYEGKAMNPYGQYLTWEQARAILLKYATSAENADKLMLAVFAPPNGTMTPPASLQPSARWSSNGQGQYIPDASLTSAEILNSCTKIATLTQTQDSAALSNECAVKGIESYFAQGSQYVIVYYFKTVATPFAGWEQSLLSQVKSQLTAKGITTWREPEWGLKPPDGTGMLGVNYKYLYVYGTTGIGIVTAIVIGFIVSAAIAGTVVALNQWHIQDNVYKLEKETIQQSYEQQKEATETYLETLDDPNVTPEERRQAILDLLAAQGNNLEGAINAVDNESGNKEDIYTMLKPVLIVLAIIAGGALLLNVYLTKK